MRNSQSLDDWLGWLESFHPKEIDLGLDRVSVVADRLNLLTWDCPVVTVAGTNGKGSCVAAIEAIYTANGYRVGAYTSPHLIRFNERIRVCQDPVIDDALVAAFELIEQARGSVSLSYFEFTTLAALVIFKEASLDLMVLEVGLGGRLDAVNLVDCSVAVITSIALDHTDWLGSDETSIAREKAGVFRSNQPVVLASVELPAVIYDHAESLQCPIYRLGTEFSFRTNEITGDAQKETSLKGGQAASPFFWSGLTPNLPSARLSVDFCSPPRVQPESLAAALQVAYLLDLPLDTEKVQGAAEFLSLPGRFQVLELEGATVILDVAHNPAAGKNLAKKLRRFNEAGRAVHCVMGILADKDLGRFIAEIQPQIDHWYPCQLQAERAASLESIEGVIKQQGGRVKGGYVSPAAAFEEALSQGGLLNKDLEEAGSDTVNLVNRDIILIIGSFYTIGEWLVWFQASDEYSAMRDFYG